MIINRNIDLEFENVNVCTKFKFYRKVILKNYMRQIDLRLELYNNQDICFNSQCSTDSIHDLELDPKILDFYNRINRAKTYNLWIYIQVLKALTGRIALDTSDFGRKSKSYRLTTPTEDLNRDNEIYNNERPYRQLISHTTFQLYLTQTKKT